MSSRSSRRLHSVLAARYGDGAPALQRRVRAAAEERRRRNAQLAARSDLLEARVRRAEDRTAEPRTSRLRRLATPRLRAPRLRTLGLGLLVALLLGPVFGAAAVSAHATLESTNPPDGATLASAPGRIRMVFSEEVTARLATIGLVAADGSRVAGTAVASDPADRSALIVTFASLPRGAYSLQWRVVDEVDLHVTSGTLVFGIGQAAGPAALPQPEPAPSLPETFLRWLDVLALSTFVGACCLRVAARRAGIGASQLASRLVPLALGGAAAALVVGVGVLAVQLAAATLPGKGLADAAGSVVETSFGAAWIARQAALAVAAVSLAWLLLRPARTAPAVAIAAALAVVAVAQSLTGHSVPGGAGERLLATAVLAVHLLSVWAWVGGLVALVAVTVPALGRGGDAGAEAFALLRAFWRVAVPSTLAIAVTGLYLAGQLVQSVDALLLTVYGQALVVKVVLVAAVACLGLRNSASLHASLRMVLTRFGLTRVVAARPGSEPPLGRRVAAEAAVALAVVLAASLMASSPPARGPAFDPVPAAVEQPPLAVPAGDLVVTVAVRPNRPGPNFVELSVLQTRKPEPAPVESVTVRLVSPSGASAGTLVARPLGQDRYEASVQSIASGGPWRFEVSVARRGLPPEQARGGWVIANPAPAIAHRRLVSDAPLAPAADTAALALLLSAGLGALVVAVVGRRRRGAVDDGTERGSDEYSIAGAAGHGRTSPAGARAAMSHGGQQ